MAKIIVETPSFDPDITVPEGTDSRVDAAEVVEAIAQKLANRSEFLRTYTDSAALVTIANTFQHAQTLLDQLISQHNVPLTPAIDVQKTAADGGGVWKLIMRMALGTSSGMNASLYTRADVANERLILATNADWTGSAWQQRDATKSSTAILFSSTGSEALQVCRMAPGAANWTTWGFGKLTASDYVYNKTRSLPVPLGNSSGDYQVFAGALFGSVLALSAGGNQHFALRFPPNMGGGVLQIMHHKTDTGTTGLQVVGLTVNWASPGTLTSAVMGGLQTSTTVGDQVTSINVGPFVDGTEYRLIWQPANVADRLLAVRLNSVTDVGPLNML
jgi:hypothetical protein